MQEALTNQNSARSVLADLRALVPAYPLRYRDALGLADRLAARFLEHHQIATLPVPTTFVSQLPKIKVHLDGSMPSLTSGSSVWDSARGCWVITLNRREPHTRQRLTLMHEFFHIVVHRQVTHRGLFLAMHPRQVEYIADYFAGCVLAPKRLLVKAWSSGIQQPDVLAEIFDVSRRAIEVRLDQVRLTGRGNEFVAFDVATAGVAS